MSRVEKLLGGLDLDGMQGLEIGALDRPVVDPACTGIRYLDHLDTPGLREKYRDDVNVDIEAIVNVSFVHQGGALADAVGDVRFDYVVASHVAEHVPDLIGWLQQAADILKPDGVLALAVPDMRYTLDGQRRLSSIIDVLDAHLGAHQRPSFRQVLDHHLNVTVAGEAGWLSKLWQDPALAAQVPRIRPHLTRNLGLGELRRYHQAIADGLYMDVHCWVWTPASMLELLGEMAWLDLMPFLLRSFHTTQRDENEFVLTLRKLPALPSDAGLRERRRQQVLASLQAAAIE